MHRPSPQAKALAVPSGLTQGPDALRSFLQSPIGPADAPMGVLLLAKSEADYFQGKWCVTSTGSG